MHPRRRHVQRIGGAVAAATFFLAAARAGNESVEPLLPFSSYLGGSGSDVARAMAFGPDGALWIAATSYSDDFPGALHAPGPGNGGDIAVLRIDPATRTVLSAAWLGGSGYDSVVALAFDGAGNAYIAGNIGSTDFPVTSGRVDPGFYAADAFVARVLPDGSGFAWVYGLGGAEVDQVAGLCVTQDGDPVVAGETHSADFPLVAPLAGPAPANRNAFVTRLRADGTGPVFSTLLGGSGRDEATAIGLAPDGTLVVGGGTDSSDFATADRIAGTYDGDFEGFLAEIDAAGATLRRTTRVGWTNVAAIASDGAGRVVVLAMTSDPDLPVPQAPHGAPSDARDALVLRLDAATWQVVDGTVFGGSDGEYYLSMAAAPDGTLWLAGSTTSDDLPVPGAVRPLMGSSEDAFLAAFDGSDLSLRFVTYLGGDHRELGYAVATAADGSAWIAGATGSTTFPLADSVQGPPPGPWPEYDVFLAHVLPVAPGPRPTAPGGVDVSATDAHAVRIRWSSSGTDVGFGVDRNREGSGFERVGVVSGGASEWIDDTVVPDRHYVYAVQTLSASGGSSPSVQVDVATPPTIDPILRSGRYRMSVVPWFGIMTGHVRLRGTLASEGRILDLRSAGVTWEFQTVTGTSDPDRFDARLDISGGSHRWRGGRRGRITWRGRGGRLAFQPSTGAFDLRFRSNQLSLGDGAPLRIRVTTGDDAGSVAPTWRPTGRRRLRTP